MAIASATTILTPIRASKTNPFFQKYQKAKPVASVPRQIYEDLNQRLQKRNGRIVQNAVDKLREKIGTMTFKQKHFGRVIRLKLKDFVINIDNQRDVDWEHVGYIIENFDPRVTQVVNAIRLPDGRYSVPEGQHTLIAMAELVNQGIIDPEVEVETKVIDHDLAVPGSDLTGEAFGNLLFRIINSKGRKAIEPYYLFRSRVNGVRYYGSTLQEDKHAEIIQQVLERYNMFAAPAIQARGFGATPGMVTYINGLLSISDHDKPSFHDAINDLDWALRLHDAYFAGQKGVDGGFILAFGRYAKLARLTNTIITKAHEDDFMRFFRLTYGSPDKFHKVCKIRLANFNQVKNLPSGWSDSCLSTVLILDFADYCTKKKLPHPVLNDLNINKFKGI